MREGSKRLRSLGLAAVVLLAVFASQARGEVNPPCGVPAALGDGWTIDSPESVGIDSTRLCHIADRLKESMTSDSTVNVATLQDLADKKVTRQNANNTWKWEAINVSDLAIGISDHYNWDAASVVVDNKTQRRTSMQAAFPDASQDFHHSVQFGRYSLAWFSNNWPGIPYPYSKSNAFQGFADMEYPMMINDSHESDLGFLRAAATGRRAP